VNSANGGNCHRQNALAPEVARHQSVTDLAFFAFDSRRLYHFDSAPACLLAGDASLMAGPDRVECPERGVVHTFETTSARFAELVM